MIVPLSGTVPPSGGFYAINNQFLKNGPKGLMEFRTLENGETFIRFDLPGVPEAGVIASLDESKSAVLIYALAPMENTHDFSDRLYATTFKPKLKVNNRKTEIVCKCHEIDSITYFMSDGVLRLIVTRTHRATQGPCLSFLAGPNGEVPVNPWCSANHAFLPARILMGIFKCGADPELSGRVLMPHACVNQGSKMAYESKQLPNGNLYVRVDMPGVPKDNFTVSVTNGRVNITGEAPAFIHDSAGRFYSGDVAMLSTPIDMPSCKIKTIAKDGVIRPPV